MFETKNLNEKEKLGRQLGKAMYKGINTKLSFVNFKLLKERLMSCELKLNFYIPVIVILVSLYPLIVIPNSWPHTIMVRYLFFLSLGIISFFIILFSKMFAYDRCMLPLFLFMSATFLSAVFSPYYLESWIGFPSRFTGFVSYLCFTVFFILSFSTARWRTKSIEEIIDNWLLSVFVIAFIGLLQYFGLNLVPFSREVLQVCKSYSSIGNSNHLGTFLVMVFPFASLCFLQKPNLRSTLFLCAVYGSLLTTLCRSAWIGLIVGLVLLFIYYPVRKNLLKLAVIILIVTALLMPVNDWSLFKQVGTFFNEAELTMVGDPEAGSGRLLLWQESIKALPGSLLIGTGPDTLLYVSKEAFEERFSEGYPAKAHNIYLEIGVTLGIPALIFYLWFLASILAQTDRRNPFQFSFFLMVIMYLVQGFFLVDVITVYPLFWVLLGFYQGLKLSDADKDLNPESS